MPTSPCVKILATFLFTASLLAASIAPAQSTVETKPNVLFIILDDMNDYAGFMNSHPNVYTPHMDALARRGIVFENAYCNSPKCVPSRVSFLAGKDPDYTNVYRNSVPFKKNFRKMFKSGTGNPDIFTIPEVFKDSGGYYTAGFDKVFHGSIYQNYNNDFDTSSVPACDKAMSWNEFTDYRDGSVVPTISQDGFTRMKFGQIPDSLEDQLEDYKTASSVIDFVTNYAANPGDYCDRPFFAAMGLYKPHNPYEVPERFFPENYYRDFNVYPYVSPCNTPNNLYPPNGHVQVGEPLIPGSELDGLPPIGVLSGLSDDSVHLFFDQFAQGLGALPPIGPGLDSSQRIDIINNSMRCLGEMAYVSTIRFADEQIGRVIEALDDYPEIRDNTIVVVTSDHGYSWRNHGHYHKGALWETDVRIPMIIVDPRRTGGKTTKGVASLIDLFPTLLELANINEPEKAAGGRYLDGQSLVPFMDDNGFSRDFPALSTIQFPGAVRDARCFPHSSVRDEEYHYIRYRTNGDPTGCNASMAGIEEELYHIGRSREIDPDELNNLAGDPDFQIIKDYLSQWLPDSSMYMTTNYSLGIETTGLSCAPAPSDPITLAGVLKNADGSPYDTTGLGLVFQWQIDPAGLTNSGPVLNTTIGSLGSADADGAVRIRLKSSLPDGTFHLEEIKLTTSPSIPSAGFTLVQDDRQIDIVPDGTYEGGYASSWSYGDGLTWEGHQPPAHAYSFPGTYTVKRTMHFGESCSLETSQTVTITAADFDPSECPTPGVKQVTGISSNQAELVWTPAFGATSYQIRARKTAFGTDGNYFTRQTGDTSIFVKNMPSDTEFEMQISAICATDTSAWDFPLRIITEPCRPPRVFETLSADSTVIQLGWLPGEGDHQKQAFRFKAGPVSTFINAGAYANSKDFEDLNPGTTYEIRGLTICNQLDGSVGKGPASQKYFASTTGAAARFPEVIRNIDLYPNPASQLVSLSFEATGQGRAQVIITDIAGKAMLSFELAVSTGLEKHEIDISGLPDGLYHTRIELGGISHGLPFVKITD